MNRLHGVVLVMEDDENDAFFLTRALMKLGPDVTPQIVADGQDGIAYLEGKGKYHDRSLYPLPRLIITDLKMPRISGFEVLHWVKHHHELSAIPVLVLSASASDRDVTGAYISGANSYMVKPADYSDLERLAKIIRDYWEACEIPRSDDARQN